MTAAVAGRIPVAAHNTRGRHASLSGYAHRVRRSTSSHRCKSHERIRRAMDTNGLYNKRVDRRTTAISHRTTARPLFNRSPRPKGTLRFDYVYNDKQFFHIFNSLHTLIYYLVDF